jgi:hypothetical protein
MAKCRPVSETGAEQMLLDVHSLQQILVEMTFMGGPKQPPPPTFTKLLNKGMQQIDQLLKMVLKPLDPIPVFLDTFLIVYESHSLSQLQKVCDIKVF